MLLTELRSVCLKDTSWVVENSNDEPVQAELNGKKINLNARGWQYQWC